MVMQYKCPGCGSDLVFDIHKQCLCCENCSREFRPEEVDIPEDAKEEAPEVTPYQAGDIEDEEQFESVEKTAEYGSFDGVAGRQYQCNCCGATVITTEDTTATSCSYCGSPVILSDRLEGELAPVKMIPFKITKEEATEQFRKWAKKGLMLPEEFKKLDRIKEVTGMYVPFWLFDMEGEGEADATATKTRSYTRGNYIYTETSYYHVYRRVHLAYSKVPADASEKMDDTLMDRLEPFDYRSLKDFKMPYLAGHLAEKYNFDDVQLLPRIHKRVDQYAQNYLSSTISGYSSVNYHRRNVTLNKVNAVYTLLPVWMVCYDYKDSEHMFAMNGQTGKVVGKRPISKYKVAAWFGGISAGLFAAMRLLTLVL